MKKENIPVMLAVALPIALVACIAILASLPNIGPKPQYDFLFTQTNSRAFYPASGGCEVFASYYSIEGAPGQQKLVKKPYEISVFDKKSYAEPCSGYQQAAHEDSPQIYEYSMQKQEAVPITFEDASRLVILSREISPDGYSVGKRYVNRGILDIFGGNDNSGVYASKRNRYTKLPIAQLDQSNYYDKDFNLIGWIDPIKQ